MKALPRGHRWASGCREHLLPKDTVPQLNESASKGDTGGFLGVESTFYPKIQFLNSMKALPRGPQVVMAFGEIDCREGILLSVNRDRYKDIQEGIQVTVGIYVKKRKNNITSFYGSSCANNGKDALNTPETEI
eukprot:1179745-Prorocentrum_minimum.AAC.1